MSRNGGDWSWQKALVIGLIALGAAILIMIPFWGYHEWDLESSGQVGDASAPIVGLLSLAAVGVALWSVRVQQVALETQRRAAGEQAQELKKQQVALETQLQIQRDALEVQRQAAAIQAEDLKKQQHALEQELQYQRHDALRKAYAPLLAAQDVYLDAVDRYWKALASDPQMDRHQRASRQLDAEDAFAALQSTRWAAQLVDNDKARGESRYYMMLHIRLEPLLDTTENQKAHLAVIHYKRLRRQTFTIKLMNSLRHEFGAEVRQETDERKAFHAKILDDAKNKSDAVEAAIKAQFDAVFREEMGRAPDAEPPPEE